MSYRKILIAGALLLMFTLGACATETGNESGTSSTEESYEEMTTVSETSITGQTSVSENEVDITITVEGKNYSFSPDKITVKKGQKVRIVLDIKEGTHDWVVDEFNAETEIKSAGTTTSVEFLADKTGSFEFYCSVGSHRALGMVGTLIVE